MTFFQLGAIVEFITSIAVVVILTVLPTTACRES